MTRHFTEAERKAAVGRLLAGERPAALARELRVTTSALRQWRARHSADLAGGVPPAAPAPAPSFVAPPVAPIEPATSAPAGEPAGLREALAVAQGTPVPMPGAVVDPALAGQLATLPDDPGQFTVDHVLAVGEVANGLAVRCVAILKGVPLDEERIEALIQFSPRERRALEMFAPYALPYVPDVLRTFPKYAAWGFVAIYGASLVGRVQAVVALAPKKPTLTNPEVSNALPAA